ncbi:DotI/IcmL/TraM family protein [Piscirickettsia litoralis]|uniref:DotI/IcmL/TraM family protein n=1 Tax=Piscirickettsia litoralis TaxID=1891921 RepID=UPI00228641D3|nr:DotI/IcmL/TraM family protein [Piscirickettsia litoralis]
MVVQKGSVNGVYSWRLQVPMIITYQQGNSKDSQNIIWSVLVQRSNEYSNSLFGVSQIIQKDNGG